MSRPGLLRAGRRAAQRGMTDTVQIFEATKEWDEATLTDVEVEVPHYTGPGKIQFFDNAHEQLTTAGAHQYTLDRSTLHLPFDAVGAVVDRYVRVTSSPLTPALVGRVFRIANTPLKSHGTAQRIPVEEVIA